MAKKLLRNLLINVSTVVAILVTNQCPVCAQLTMKHCQVYDMVNKKQLTGTLDEITKKIGKENLCIGNCENIKSNAKNENKGLYSKGSLDNMPYCSGHGSHEIET